MGLDSSVGRLRGLQRLVALLVCLLLAISLLPVGSAQAVQGEAPSPEMLVWVATEPLEANSTTLLATAELAHLDKNTGPVHFSLIHSGKGWNFTAEKTDKVPAEGENTTVQIHVRPPADAKEGDRARAVLMVENPGEPSSDPVFLYLETPPVNGSSLMPDASVMGTTEATASWVEEAGQEQWAAAIELMEHRSKQVEGLVHDIVSDGGPSVPEAPDLPDTPEGPSNPNSKSKEDWVWYAAETFDSTYDSATGPISDPLPGHDIVRESGKNHGVQTEGRAAPEVSLKAGLKELYPAPPESPMGKLVSNLMGPPSPGMVEESSAQAKVSGKSSDGIPAMALTRFGSADTGGEPTGSPSEYDPSTQGKRPSALTGDSDERTAPSTTTTSEVAPLPFHPVLGVVVLVGFTGGAVIGTAVMRPESLLARWFTKIVSILGGVKLFSRTTGPDVLKHRLRSQIHDAISKEPGITISALADLIGVNRSTLRYHLRTLEREELIRYRSEAKACHLYPNGKGDQDAKSASRYSLFYRYRVNLANVILNNPGLPQIQVAKRVGLPHSRVNLYTRTLVEEGLVRVEKDGRYCRYFPTETLQSIGKEGFLPGVDIQ